MGWRGVFAGALMLAMLEAVVSSQAASGRVGGIFTGIGTITQHFLDPSIPAISWAGAINNTLGGSPASTSTSTTSTAAATTTAPTPPTTPAPPGSPGSPYASTTPTQQA